MSSTRLAHPTAALGARLLPPLAAIASLAVLAGSQIGTGTGTGGVLGAETAYLALAAGVVLLSAAAVAAAGHGGLAVAAGSLLTAVAAWALPEGPSRGAVVMALAAGTLAVAAGARLKELEGFGSHDRRRFLTPVAVVGLAVGAQALLRGGELPTTSSMLRSAALFVAFPVVGALAVLALERVYGRGPSLLAGAVAILVAPGFRPASLVALTAVAAAPWLFRPSVAGRLGQLGAAALLLAPFAWDPRAALVAVAAGLAGALALGPARSTARRARRAWLAPAVAAAALVALGWLPATRPWPESLSLASLVVLAVPAVLWMGGRVGAALATRWATLWASLSALLLALGAGRGVLVEGGLAAPAALAGLVAFAGLVRPTTEGEEAPGAGAFRRSVRAAQAVWSVAALGLAGLLGAYPWLRTEPFRDLLPLFGLEASPVSALLALLALGAVAGLGLFALRLRDLLPDGPVPGPAAVAAWAAGAMLFVVLLLGHPPGAGPIGLGGSAGGEREAVVLDAGRPLWNGTGAAGPIRRVVVDSSLANAAALPAGTPVATVRLSRTGAPEEAWPLRAGVETGEWAAARPDLRAAETPAPAPWLSWVAEGGFFGQRYRAALPVDGPAIAEEGPARVTVELRDDLPEGVSLTLFHVEARP